MTESTTTLQQLTSSDVDYVGGAYRSPAGQKLLRRFNSNMNEHVMTVLRDDSLYRHLRFSKPGTGMYRFDLITWPGHLTITGDIGTYTFSRVEDMFDFFQGYINTDYWAEKLRHGPGGATLEGVLEHDRDEFRTWLVADFWAASRDMNPTLARIWWETLRMEILDTYSGAHIDSKEGCLRALDDLGPEYRQHYADTWECDWSRYVVQFELCLAAIVTGIRTYRAQAQEQEVAL